jgi:hypothetical protein
MPQMSHWIVKVESQTVMTNVPGSDVLSKSRKMIKFPTKTSLEIRNSPLIDRQQLNHNLGLRIKNEV